jgi:hypothetical protein
VIVAGEDYECGSSRDWAAKGPALIGVRAVIARVRAPSTAQTWRDLTAQREPVEVPA